MKAGLGVDCVALTAPMAATASRVDAAVRICGGEGRRKGEKNEGMQCQSSVETFEVKTWQQSQRVQNQILTIIIPPSAQPGGHIYEFARCVRIAPGPLWTREYRHNFAGNRIWRKKCKGYNV